MQCIPGFDPAAADVMRRLDESVNGPAPDYLDRCRKADFWALYDGGQPCGGIVIEQGVIHVSSLRPCGLAVRRVLREALTRFGVLIAPIRPENARAQRLAVGLGFTFWQLLDGFLIYRRQST